MMILYIGDDVGDVGLDFVFEVSRGGEISAVCEHGN